MRLLHRYADRKATHEALRLAENVYAFLPKYGWTVEQRMVAEGQMLRERADATEVVLRVLTAYVLIDNGGGVYPDARAEWTQVGKLVLSPLSRWRDQGQTRVRVYGRIVTLFGEHAASILAPFCIALLHKAVADDEALVAAVKASTNFDAIEETTDGN